MAGFYFWGVEEGTTLIWKIRERKKEKEFPGENDFPVWHRNGEGDESGH